MALTKQQQFYVITDAIGPALFTLYICISRYRRHITHSMFLTFWFGVFIGSLWEIPFGLAGDSFLVPKFDNPLGFGVHILHSFWDSMIFLFGMYFIHTRKKIKRPGHLQLLLLILWGLFQEFIVELLFNNKYWYYKTDNKYNRVVFTIKGVSYTCIPYLVWILFPILYLSGVFSIIETCGPLYKNKRIINDDRSRNLIDSGNSNRNHLRITVPDTSSFL
jgi:hypothetical protein